MSDKPTSEKAGARLSDPTAIPAGSDLARRKHTDVLTDWLPVRGLRIADVGCGDGALVRFLARAGASEPIGVEISERLVDRAEAAGERIGPERFLLGRGEELPFSDESLDAVIYFNALHHVPDEVMGAALDEAARVLEPGGMLYIVEPLATGAYFEMIRSVEDETEVRARAYERIATARERPGWEELVEYHYTAPYRMTDFDDLRERVLGVDEARRPAFEANETQLHHDFERLAERTDDGDYLFWQPARLNLLRRVSAP